MWLDICLKGFFLLFWNSSFYWTFGKFLNKFTQIVLKLLSFWKSTFYQVLFDIHSFNCFYSFLPQIFLTFLDEILWIFIKEVNKPESIEHWTCKGAFLLLLLRSVKDVQNCLCVKMRLQKYVPHFLSNFTNKSIFSSCFDSDNFF